MPLCIIGLAAVTTSSTITTTTGRNKYHPLDCHHHQQQDYKEDKYCSSSFPTLDLSSACSTSTSTDSNSGSAAGNNTNSTTTTGSRRRSIADLENCETSANKKRQIICNCSRVKSSFSSPPSYRQHQSKSLLINNNKKRSGSLGCDRLNCCNNNHHSDNMAHEYDAQSASQVPASAPPNVLSFFSGPSTIPLISTSSQKPAITIMTTTPEYSAQADNASPRSRRIPPPAPLLLSSSTSSLSSPSSLTLSAIGGESGGGTTSLPTPLTPSFSSRKHRNAKQLSLMLPGGASQSSPTSTLTSTSTASSLPFNGGLHPTTSSPHNLALNPPLPNKISEDNNSSENLLDLSETKSCPPTPRLVINTEQANQVMLDQSERDEIKSSLAGDMSMRRRSSLPRLNILASKLSAANDSNIPPPTPSIQRPKTGIPALTVEALVARNREAGAPLQADSSEAGEEFPYQYGPKEILPGLFLGSEQNAKDPHILRRLGITQVLCCAKEVACPWLLDDIIQEEEDGESDQEDKEDEVIHHSDTENQTLDLTPDVREASQASEDNADTSGDSFQSTHLAAPSDTSRRSSRSSLSAHRPAFLRPAASTPNLKRQFLGTPEEHNTNVRLLDGKLSAANGVQSPVHPDPLKRGATQSHAGYIHRHFSANRLNGRPAIEYTKLPWGHDEDDVAKHFETFRICEIIDKARRNGGRCLIHCQLGVSRSATLMIGYCMRQAFSGRDGQSLDQVKTMHDSYTFVRSKSRWVAPNIGLLAQLVQYERVLSAENKPNHTLPYTNSAYYDSQLALPVQQGSQTPDNLSPSSTSESEVDSRLTTPDAMAELLQSGNEHRITIGHPSGQLPNSPLKSNLGKSQVDEQLSPMTAAMRLSKPPASPRFLKMRLEHTSFGSAQRKRQHKKTFSADLSNFARTFAPYATHE